MTAELASLMDRVTFADSLDSVRLSIQGMTCASCSSRVSSATEGVETAQVNLATEIATVAFTPGVISVEREGSMNLFQELPPTAAPLIAHDHLAWSPVSP